MITPDFRVAFSLSGIDAQPCMLLLPRVKHPSSISVATRIFTSSSLFVLLRTFSHFARVLYRSVERLHVRIIIPILTATRGYSET